ncbi:MAG: hypothetical protein K6F88_03395 [Ruminococcus sp.]|nr:hypothetical protein [Ruminococcus sp.]
MRKPKDINIIDFIPYGEDRAITKKQLKRLLGLRGRKIRHLISQARKERVILNLQNGKGYFQPLDEEQELVKRFYYQEKHRNEEHRATLRPVQNWLYMKGIV